MEEAELQKLQTLFGAHPPKLLKYGKNTVTPCTFQDKKSEGGGPLRLNLNYHLLILELEKVIGESKTPLPGVTFEASLYSREKKQTMMRMAELITGLTGQTEEPRPGYAASAPIDMSHYFDILSAVYPEDLKEPVIQKEKRTQGTDVSSHFGNDQEHTVWYEKTITTQTLGDYMEKVVEETRYYETEDGQEPYKILTESSYKAVILLTETEAPDYVENADWSDVITVESHSLKETEENKENMDKGNTVVYDKTFTGENAIVNQPLSREHVILTKYGYTRRDGLNYQAAGNTALNEDEWLDKQLEFREKSVLEGVKLELQKYNEATKQWEKVQEGYFVTDASGEVDFGELEPGEYRVMERDLGRYADTYENAHATEEKAFTFAVSGGDTRKISMYNPKKPRLIIRKMNRGLKYEAALGEAEFSVNDKTYKASDFRDGNRWQSVPIEADTKYLVRETKAAPGYTTKGTVTEQSFTAAFDGQSWLKDNTVILDFLNEQTGSAEVTKKDSVSGKALPGAEFRLEYVPFAADDFAMQEVGAGYYFGNGNQIPVLNYNAVADPPEDGWTEKQAGLISDEQGRIKTEDLAPGWYRLTETKAPENYELNPKPETFCITAGMHLLGQGWESWQNDNAPEKVRKNIENVPYGSLTLQKEYRSAKELTKGETRAVFGLYTKEEKEYQEFQTLTVSEEKPVVSVTLPEGTYYLKEKSAGKDWKLRSIENSEGMLSPDAQGYYPVEVKRGLEEQNALAVTAVNENTRVKITLLKLEGEAYSESAKRLPGAKFEIFYRDAKGEEQKITDLSGKDVFVSGEKGEVSAEFAFPAELLQDETVWTEGHSFIIREVEAPDNYAKDETDHEITLKPGEVRSYSTDSHAQEYSLVFFNKKGMRIEIHKFGGGYEGNKQDKPLRGADFALCEIRDGEAVPVRYGDGGAVLGTTNENGVLVFDHLDLDSRKTYAILETGISDAQNKKLYGEAESVWQHDADTPLRAQEVTYQGQKRTAFLLSGLQPGGRYEYDAYNRHKDRLYINKVDYSRPDERALASFSIYEADENGNKKGEPLAVHYSNSVTDVTYEQFGTVLETGGTRKVEIAGTEYAATTAALRLEPGTYYVEEVETAAPHMLYMRDSRIEIGQTITIEEASGAEVRDYTLNFKNIQEKPDVTIAKEPVGLKNEKGEVVSDLNLLTETGQVQFKIGGSRVSGQVKGFVLNNFLPLTSFAVTDENIRLYTDVNGTELLKENLYSIGSVELGGASYRNYLRDYKGGGAGETVTGITAIVTFEDAAGKICVKEVTLGAPGTSVTAVPDAGFEAVRFTVEYVDKALRDIKIEAESGVIQRTLGSDFQADPITVTVDLKKQQEGETVKPVQRVDNEAAVNMRYYNPGQSQAVEGESPVEEKRAKASQLLNPVFDIPEVTLTQEVQKGGKPIDAASMNDEITYHVEIANVTKDKKLSLKDPIISNPLPDHVDLLNKSAGVFRIRYEGCEELKTLRVETEVRDGKTYLNIWLDGELPPGAKIILEYDVKILSSVMENASLKLKGEAYLTTEKKGIVWKENPHGLSFTPAGEGDSLKSEEIDGVLGIDNPNGYLRDKTEISVTAKATLIRSKSVKDENGNFISGRTVNIPNGGTAEYRLLLQNTGSTPAEDIRILDYLPRKGDISAVGSGERFSNWTPAFGQIESVIYYPVKNLEGEHPVFGEPQVITDYTLYGAAAADDYDGLLDAAQKEEIGGAWTQGAGEEDHAILLKLPERVSLKKYERIEIIYSVKVPQFAREELEAITGLPAVNDFASITTSNGSLDNPLDSNQVKIMVAGTPVGVGGDVWIDENRNGIQDDGIMAKAQDVPKVDVTLQTYQNDSPTESSQQTSDKENHFVFDGLKYSIPSHENLEELYTKDNTLLPGGLAGQEKVNYQLSVKVPDGYDVTESFANTNGKKTRSEKPSVVNAVGAPGRTDSNFAGGGNLYSERFYLWPTENDAGAWDMSKDIGLVKTRDLIIEKLDAETKEPVSGAGFEVYGPFTPDRSGTIAPKEEELTKDKLVGTYTTQADGKITVPDLSYFEGYVIREVTAPLDYRENTGAVLVTEPAQNKVQKSEALSKAHSTFLLLAGSGAEALKEQEQARLTIQLTNEPKKGALTVHKKSTSEKPLAGAEFELAWMGNHIKAWEVFADKIKEDQSLVTGASALAVEGTRLIFTIGDTGTATVSELPLGTYTLKETKAPPNYALDTTVRTFTLDAGSVIHQEYTVRDQPDSRLQIHKTAPETETANKTFRFKVTVSGRLYTGMYYVDDSPTAAKDGVLTVDAGQTAEIRGLEEGEKFTVQEVDHNQESYETTWKVGDGEAREGVLAEGTISPDGQNVTKVTFTNVLRTGSVKLGSTSSMERPEVKTTVLRSCSSSSAGAANRLLPGLRMTAVLRRLSGTGMERRHRPKLHGMRKNRAIP